MKLCDLVLIVILYNTWCMSFNKIFIFCDIFVKYVTELLVIVFFYLFFFLRSYSVLFEHYIYHAL